MQKSKDRVTMRAIAEEADVTLTTVSRILNHKGDKYADSTKKKIFEIANRLKYRPNALVHGMQSGITRTAGVMMPADSWFYCQITGGIQNTFFEHNTVMLLGWNPLAPNKADPEHERGVIHQMVDRRVDGVILRPSAEEFERSYFEEIWERDIPLILVDREMTNVTTDFVGTDNVAGGRAAAEYLVTLGHRQLLFVGQSDQVSTSRHREEGFRQLLSETPNASCLALRYDYSEQDAAAVIELLKSGNRPSAVFCYNDDMAEVVAGLAQQAGLTVPMDLSIVGFGNQPMQDPKIPFTTFDQNAPLIGRTAAQMYVDRIYGKEKNNLRHELVPTELIVRASTAAPRG